MRNQWKHQKTDYNTQIFNIQFIIHEISLYKRNYWNGVFSHIRSRLWVLKHLDSRWLSRCFFMEY